MDYHVEFFPFYIAFSFFFSLRSAVLLNASFATSYTLAISGVHRLAARYRLVLLVLLFITDVSILLISVSGSFRDSYSGAYPGPSYNRYIIFNANKDVNVFLLICLGPYRCLSVWSSNRPLYSIGHSPY